MPTEADPRHHKPAKEGPLGRGAGGLIARAGEPLYRYAMARWNRGFDAGKGVTRLDRPVISVGNLSVGGTGKTPMVAKLAAELLGAGKRPCIAMRGYAKDRTGKSDEAQEYERLLPDVPVVAQPDRIAGLRRLLDSPGGTRVDVVILDDGFQHRKIARDVDIVLIDASAGTLEDRLLPAGWLREPLEALARAHAVVVTHAERAAPAEVECIVDRVRSVNPNLVTAACRHGWAGVRRDHDSAVLPLDTLAGKRALVVSAIGNPSAFSGAVRETAAAAVKEELRYPDHDPYAPATVATILRRAAGMDAVVTTEKDWMKLGKAKVDWPCPVYRPVLELIFDRGWSDLWALAARGAGIGATSPILSATGVGGKVEATARGS